MQKKIIGLFAFLSIFSFCQAQNKKNLDKIVLIVGEHIALQSEVNQVLKEYEANNLPSNDSVRCQVMEGILSKYLLCEQANRDSVIISDEEVNATLDNRLRYMEQVYGSAEKLEEALGKTESQIKEDYKRYFRDLLTSQRMQGQIQQGMKISPAEVRTFFDKIPKDSLPMYPSMVEVGQLVLAPTANSEAEDYVKQQLLDIKKQILEGKAEFETMAGIYSQDPGSKNLGGKLGAVSRDEMVPEFSAVGFRLQNGEISDPVKTKFGYHIIYMEQRMGEKAKLSHILLKPTITSIDIVNCKTKLDSIRKLVVNGTMTFAEAVNKFSIDERSKSTGGMFINGAGSSLLTMEELGPEAAVTAGAMKAGEYSAVLEFDATEENPTSSATPKENINCRFLFLKSISEPHIADINKDFNRIQQVALEEKRNKFLLEWVSGKVNDFYIRVDADYENCGVLSKRKK